MAMFQQYQGGIAPVQGISEAGARIGQMAQSGMVDFGKSLSDGLKAYNENSAKDQILTQEAQVLGGQIQQYAQMFGNSPEHAEFTQSLQPYIEQLAKVPSQSLTQKMGTVTGVKAAFANIGQQLQVFELMRNERMKRDINTAMGGVTEFDEVTVPTAIVQSGKLPYFYNKSYAENEAEVVRLTNEAKQRGANVDLPSVLNNWRAENKANAMSRNDLPPAVKEALVKQIDSSKNLEDNIQTDETSGVTDYAKEAEMYARTSTSVKDQLAPPKVEPTTTGESKPEPTEIEKLLQRKASAKTAIDALTGKYPAKPKPKEYTYDEVMGMAKSAEGNTYDTLNKFVKVTNADGKTVYIDEKEHKKSLNEVWTEGKKPSAEVEGYLQFYKDQIKQADRDIDKLEVAQRAKDELSTIDSLISQADVASQRGEDIPRGWWNKLNDKLRPMLDSANLSALESYTRLQINQGKYDEITPEVARTIMKDVIKGGDTSTLAMYGSLITPDPAAFDISSGFGFAGSSARELKKNEVKALENAFKEWSSKDVLNKAIESKDSDYIKQVLTERKALLEGQALTGQSAPKPSDIAKAQQTTAAQEAKQEPEYTLTNQRNISLGTTTAKVATSIESKRNDMKKFFTQKYGYVPASFEESFKAIYPEANFKTMETPYGVFMHDGKGWNQIKVDQPKVMSNKEIGEEKAVTFGKPTADGNLDFSELVPNSGIYLRGVYAGTPTEANKFRTEMLETANARIAVNRLIEINDMVGESMPWNAKLWGEAKALLPQIKAGLRTDIIGVGTVSNYEQQLIEEVVADPTKFWSLESSDRAKLAEIMRRVNNRLTDKPAVFGLEVKVAGKSNAEVERNLRMGRSGKSKLELDFEARGNKKGVDLNWGLTNKIPDALK